MYQHVVSLPKGSLSARVDLYKVEDGKRGQWVGALVKTKKGFDTHGEIPDHLVRNLQDMLGAIHARSNGQ